MSFDKLRIEPMSFTALKYLRFFDFTMFCFEPLLSQPILRFIWLGCDAVPSVELHRLLVFLFALFLAQILMIELPISAAVMFICVLNRLCLAAADPAESVDFVKWCEVLPVVLKKFLITSDDFSI